MSTISARLGEFLVKTTGTSDIDNALHKVFADYLELKLANLNGTIAKSRLKWGMGFEEFKAGMKAGTLAKDAFSHEVEKDFWEWEEAETLKKHYETLKEEWI